MGNLQTLKLEYEEYLRNQRGLSERSIYHCWRFADRFLAFRFKGKDRDLSKITPPDVARFMQHLTSRGKPLRDKTPPTHLRNFFQFLSKCVSGLTTYETAGGRLGRIDTKNIKGDLVLHHDGTAARVTFVPQSS